MSISTPFQVTFVLASTIELEAYRSTLLGTFGMESSTDLVTSLIGGVHNRWRDEVHWSKIYTLILL